MNEADLYMHFEVYDAHSGHPANFRWVVSPCADSPDDYISVQYEEQERGKGELKARGEPLSIGVKGARKLAEALNRMADFMEDR